MQIQEYLHSHNPKKLEKQDYSHEIRMVFDEGYIYAKIPTTKKHLFMSAMNSVLFQIVVNEENPLSFGDIRSMCNNDPEKNPGITLNKMMECIKYRDSLTQLEKLSPFIKNNAAIYPYQDTKFYISVNKFLCLALLASTIGEAEEYLVINYLREAIKKYDIAPSPEPYTGARAEILLLAIEQIYGVSFELSETTHKYLWRCKKQRYGASSCWFVCGYHDPAANKPVRHLPIALIEAYRKYGNGAELRVLQDQSDMEFIIANSGK